MKISSPAFNNNGKIPEKYTCDGSDISPQLEFSDIPENAKTLVLIMDDPDIPDFVKQKFQIQIWDHWVVFNIPPNIKKIDEGKAPEGILGLNTSKKLGYQGPCPPDKQHKYFFKLYALDTALNLKQGCTKKEVEKAMKDHIIEKAELIGLYERKT